MKPLVVVGDSLLDVDIEGSATRLSPDAPVPVVDGQAMWQRPGGAGLAALLAARSATDVVLVTAVGDDPAGRTMVDLLGAAGVRVLGLPMVGDTVCKTRIRAGGHPLVRLDHGDGVAAAEPLTAEVRDVLAGARAVLAADYGNGVTSHPELRCALEDFASRHPLVWDPHPRGADPVAGAALVTPNEHEAVGRCPEDLRRRWAARAVSVTLGARGALLSTGAGPAVRVPVPPGVVARDSCGAGDRFAVAATTALAAGAGVNRAVEAAVEAAARFVAAGGAASVSTPAAVGIPALPVGETIVGDDVDAVARRLRRRGGRLVATGGCFDLLHTGHVRLLRQARDHGDALVVLVNSDASVAALKGPDRPVMAAADRARVLAALACVDAVCVFGEASPAAALERLRPDVWVKGGDYRAEDLPEAETVTRHGGEVVIVPTVAGYSSSGLIASMLTRADQG